MYFLVKALRAVLQIKHETLCVGYYKSWCWTAALYMNWSVTGCSNSTHAQCSIYWPKVVPQIQFEEKKCSCFIFATVF